MDLNPYLTFDGNLEEAFAFYAEVLGGEIVVMQRFADMPGSESLPEAARGRVMHAELKLGDRKLMGSDTMGQDPWAPPASVHLQTGWEDVETARKVFNRLAEGGEVVMPFAKTFWSEGFGICRDRFQVPWMVNVHGPDLMSS